MPKGRPGPMTLRRLSAPHSKVEGLDSLSWRAGRKGLTASLGGPTTGKGPTYPLDGKGSSASSACGKGSSSPLTLGTGCTCLEVLYHLGGPLWE